MRSPTSPRFSGSLPRWRSGVPPNSLADGSSVHAQVGKPEGLYYKSWAVVVGVENYLVAPKVPGALESAHAVAAALRELGFDEVIELQDKEASSRRLLQILNDHLPRKSGTADRVVMFFSGHAGVTQDVQSKDLGFVVPWDAQLNNPGKAITPDQLKEFSRRSASKHLLFSVRRQSARVGMSPLRNPLAGGPLLAGRRHRKTSVQVITAAERRKRWHYRLRTESVRHGAGGRIEGAADSGTRTGGSWPELAAQVRQGRGARHERRATSAVRPT